MSEKTSTDNGPEPPLPRDDAADAVDLEKLPEPAPPDALPPRYSIYTTWQKRGIVLLASIAAFFSPLSAQIYLPALTSIADDLHVTNSQINLTITTYMIFQGVTPMFIGSLADSGGRRPAYLACFVIYIAANIGIALAPNYSALLGIRCLQSAGSSSTVALNQAVVADIITSAERGQYIGLTVVPIILAPALGPVIGGLLSQYLGWRSIFWFLTITSGVVAVIVGAIFPETNRHIADDGSRTPPLMYQSLWQIFKRRGAASKGRASDAPADEKRFKFKAPNPIGSLLMLFELETAVLLWPGTIIFAGFYSLSAAIPTLFRRLYGYDDVVLGLCYLPLALGAIVASTVAGPFMNWNFKRHCLRLGIPFDRSRQLDLSDFPIERARLEISVPLLLLAGSSMIAWGWTLEAGTSVAAPLVLSVLIGTGMIGYTNTSNVLLVDMHPGKAGTATAAYNLTRCLVGAGFTAAIIPMTNAVGPGWAFTIIGGMYFLCIPVLLLLMAKGKTWRAQRKSRLQQRKEAKEAKEAKKAERQETIGVQSEVTEEKI